MLWELALVTLKWLGSVKIKNIEPDLEVRIEIQHCS